MNTILSVQDHKKISPLLNEVKSAVLFLYEWHKNPLIHLVSDLEEKMLSDHHFPRDDNSCLKIYYGQQHKNLQSEPYPTVYRKQELCSMLEQAKKAINKHRDKKFIRLANAKIEKVISDIQNWPEKTNDIPRAV